MPFILFVGIFSCEKKSMVSAPFNTSPTPCARRTNLLEKYFTHVFLCLSRLIRSSDPPFSSSTIDFPEYRDTGGLSCPLVFYGIGVQ